MDANVLSIKDIVDALRARRLRVCLDDDDAISVSPSLSLSDDDKVVLKARRAELLQLLRDEQTPTIVPPTPTQTTDSWVDHEVVLVPGRRREVRPLGPVDEQATAEMMQGIRRSKEQGWW